ncbi:hypothetical protein B6D60_10835 [candidate division KSB1 bacterium 4484_87]|nr:MAG: hypothetical protein B6D60_10835 [candidate division KSB1 bacterium 4484_87]
MFTKEMKDDVTIIKINQDRLDAVVAPDLKTELLLSVDNGVTNVLIDLSAVNYADSSGLGALLFGLRQLKNLGGQLKLLGANNRVMSLIKIARLEKHLPNFEEKETALKSFHADV